MPRIPRSYMETTFFHVITQGINRSYIFNNSDDIKYYIKTIYNLKNEYNIKIIAYCIMNNHAHILMQVKNVNEMSKYMQRVNVKYGIYYNNKYNRVGYVFRDRYKSEGIYNEEHLYNCIKYIYDNPVKAGLCKNASEYPYSNYKNINKSVTGEYKFLEVCEKESVDCNKIVEDFLRDNQINKNMIRNNETNLNRVTKTLKDEYGIPLRKISEILNINREKIRRIYNR